MELLQIATAQFITYIADGFITNCDSFFITKVRYGLLQIATGITKCDNYYKLRQYTYFPANKMN